MFKTTAYKHFQPRGLLHLITSSAIQRLRTPEEMNFTHCQLTHAQGYFINLHEKGMQAVENLRELRDCVLYLAWILFFGSVRRQNPDRHDVVEFGATGEINHAHIPVSDRWTPFQAHPRLWRRFLSLQLSEICGCHDTSLPRGQPLEFLEEVQRDLDLRALLPFALAGDDHQEMLSIRIYVE